jgi:hypothetical protein
MMKAIGMMLMLCTISGAALIMVYVLFKAWLKQQERKWAFTLKQDNNKALAALRITAYERLTVMLERIVPQALVMRHNTGGLSAQSLQLDLVRAVREEFEHNVSLQIYVSPECWERVVAAKEETAQLIKIAFTRLPAGHSALELSGEILRIEAEVGNPAIRNAIQAIRLEMAKYY